MCVGLESFTVHGVAYLLRVLAEGKVRGALTPVIDTDLVAAQLAIANLLHTDAAEQILLCVCLRTVTYTKVAINPIWVVHCPERAQPLVSIAQPA